MIPVFKKIAETIYISTTYLEEKFLFKFKKLTNKVEF